MARLLAVLRGVDSLGLSLDQQLAVVMGRRDADTETARAQVSCDWWRAGHVTTVLIADWSRVRQRGGAPRAEEELRARALRQERQLQIPRRQQVHI